MRIAIDLDGVICENKKLGEKYEDVSPIYQSAETIRGLKANGHEIVIFTARNMGTFNHNIGKVNAFQIKIIVDWLTKWEIPFDEIWSKPNCDIFIDDKAVKFTNWENIKQEIK